MNAPAAPNSDQNTNGFDPNLGPRNHYGNQPQYDNQNFNDSNQRMGYDSGAYPAQSYRQPVRSEEDPGKVLGIISLVATLSTFLGFNFIGPIVGIITGHMARNSSRRAGYADNEMGKWGFILGIVFLSVAALGGLLGLSVGAFAGLFGLLGV